MELVSHMVLSLVMADVAKPSLAITSLTELPSLVRVEPRYLKLLTSSSFYPLSVMEVVL